MRITCAIVALVSAACVNAANFRVIAPGAKGDVQVSVRGQRTKLTANDPDVPYFTGDADCSGSCPYKYVVNGVEETFERTLNGEATLNDVFQRQLTYASLPPLPHPIKNDPWTRGGSKGSIWDDQYIPSIFITGDQSKIENLISNVPEENVDVKFTIIGPDQAWTVENCAFRIHGAGKKKNNAKQSWEWSLPKGKYIDNRNWFKIRHMEEDPTQMREKLYADVLGALDTYANRANMVRLFVNGLGFGTFNMLDDVIQYSYINAMWYNGKSPKQMGPLYDGASGADFKYYSDSEHYEESWKPNEESPDEYDPIMDFTEAFQTVDTTKDAEIEKLDKKFDIDQFLRFMVVEYLTADWDGYWMQQTNLGAYSDPTENGRWYYLGQDFDATFGVNLVTPEERVEFAQVSYKDYPERYPDSVMINRLLENTKIRNTFETYLKDTVRILFNDQTLSRRVIAYHDFIASDLKWDRSIRQLSPGINFGWSFEQTSENLYHKVEAPNDNGGGADWGLLQWIKAKSTAVAKEFNLTILSASEALEYSKPSIDSKLGQSGNTPHASGDDGAPSEGGNVIDTDAKDSKKEDQKSTHQEFEAESLKLHAGASTFNITPLTVLVILGTAAFSFI